MQHIHALSARDLEEIEARFSLKKALRTVGKVAKAAVKVAPAAALLLRDEEGNMYIRDLGEDEYDIRDFADDFDTLDARDGLYILDSATLDARSPQPFKISSIIKKVKKVAGTVGKAVGTVSNVVSTLGLRDDVDLAGRDLAEGNLEELD